MSWLQQIERFGNAVLERSDEIARKIETVQMRLRKLSQAVKSSEKLLQTLTKQLDAEVQERENLAANERFLATQWGEEE